MKAEIRLLGRGGALRLPLWESSLQSFIEKGLDHIRTVAILMRRKLVDLLDQFIFETESGLHLHTPILRRIALFDNNIPRQSFIVNRYRLLLENCLTMGYT